jgi:hypothetical protein
VRREHLVDRILDQTDDPVDDELRAAMRLRRHIAHGVHLAGAAIDRQDADHDVRTAEVDADDPPLVTGSPDGNRAAARGRIPDCA